MSLDWKTKLDAAVAENAGKVVRLRRHLHANPEVSGEELQTSLHLYQLLDKLDLEVRMGPEGCGVVADSKVVEAANDGSPALAGLGRIAFPR